jgi:aspartyl-tRNA(Asn)/glutamyl-tRNA(Gln) amidotransferase subunit C
MLTEKEVRHVAELARIGLTDEELEKFKSQLSTILDFVNQLQKLKTDNIKPLSQTTGLKNVFRQDLALPSLPQKDVLANAPATYKGYFKTKPVFDAP